MTKYRPYNLWIPPFETTSGGIRVLYGLLGWLLAKGQEVVTNAKGPGFVTIYPEIVHGNPLEGDRVVRYILATPGVMGMGGVPGPTEFDDSEIKYVFSKLYNTLNVDKSHIMFLPILNLHIFKVTNKGKRTKKCKFVGKGLDLHLPQTEGLFEVTRPFAQDQQQLADYLNQCEVMYSYDNNSAMFEIARLCGCQVVIIPSIYSKEEFSKYEPGMDGIMWGLEEDCSFIPDEFRSHYISLVDTFQEKLERFIDETQH